MLDPRDSVAELSVMSMAEVVEIVLKIWLEVSVALPPVQRRVPPLRVTTLLELPRLPSASMERTPPEMVTPPNSYVFGVFQPGGYQMLLRGEPMPARFRNGFEKPEPLKANEVTKLSFVMPGIAHTFKKGHRIMVQIQSTWFPLVARNPQRFMTNYKHGTEKDFQKATQRVYFGGKQASAIILPVLNK